MNDSPERTALLTSLSDIGVLLTKMDTELGAARADNPPVDGNLHIQRAHSLLAQCGEAAYTMDMLLSTDTAPTPVVTPPVVSPPVTPPPVTPPPVVSPPGPTGTRSVAWKPQVGIITVPVTPGAPLSWEMKVPASFTPKGGPGYFAIVPGSSDGNAYWTRTLCISDKPGDFSTKLGTAAMGVGTEASIYFTVGGQAKDKYGRDIVSPTPDLTPGKTYYLNVVQHDGAACTVDFKFAPPPGTI